MNNTGIIHVGRIRLLLFAAVTVLHITVILTMVIHMNPAIIKPDAPNAGIMKLVDIQDEIPAALPSEQIPSPPPQPQLHPQPPVTVAEQQPKEASGTMPDTQELIAETVIETDETPPPAVIGGGKEADSGTGGGVPGGTGNGEIVYLPQNMITRRPELPENRIIRNIVYPAIARRANIEGSVYLELFIDRQGNIQRISILRETPSGRGFGEAAVNAFKGIIAKPAEVNGESVAVRYRYNISFTLK